MRVLPSTLRERWWARCRGPSWWQRQDGWPQRFCTWARLAASRGPVGAIRLTLLSSMRRISVGCSGTRIGTSRPSGKYHSYRDRPEKPEVRGKEILQRLQDTAKSVLPLTWAASRCEEYPIPQSWRIFTPGTSSCHRIEALTIRSGSAGHWRGSVAASIGVEEFPGMDLSRAILVAIYRSGIEVHGRPARDSFGRGEAESPFSRLDLAPASG